MLINLLNNNREINMKLQLITTAIMFGLLASGCSSNKPDLDSGEVAVLNTKTSTTVDRFIKETSGANNLLNNSKGYLICPKITKGGFIVGVEGGKCEMWINGKVVEYYQTRSAKLGLLVGIQSYSMILVFNSQAAIDTFMTGEREWEIGVDASVAVAKIGMSGKLDTTNLNRDIVALVFGEKGLMADLSLEGASFKKLTTR